jgi:hypothetical protein
MFDIFLSQTQDQEMTKNPVTMFEQICQTGQVQMRPSHKGAFLHSLQTGIPTICANMYYFTLCKQAFLHSVQTYVVNNE